MFDPLNYGIVHGDQPYSLIEEPTEIDCGIYTAEAVGCNGQRVEVELEGWGDGDFDFDNPLSIG